jgi:excisionase family DNA binding protein
MTEEMITSKEVARILKISLRRIQWMAQVGKLPCYRLSPRIIRFSRKEIEEFLLKNRHPHIEDAS